MNLSFTQGRCWTRAPFAAVLAFGLPFGLIQLPASLNAQTTPAQSTPAPQQQNSVPDAPTPQAPKPMSDFKDQVTPGLGSAAVGADSPTGTAPSTSTSDAEATPSRPPANTGPDPGQPTPPEQPESGKGVEGDVYRIRTNTNAVEVPITVKDSKGGLVAGLTYRDFQVYENNERQSIQYFTVDPFPLSVAYVIDQSVTADVMAKVNSSLGAIQGSLTPYDEVAVFSYNNGPSPISQGFTGAQTAHLTAVLATAQVAKGREEVVPMTGGALYGCAITSNQGCVDPNLQVGRSAGAAEANPYKENHTLNDAILMAAKELARRPQGHRRIIYVISDGKESGSKATIKEVIKFLQTNNIAVYATLVGDSARWGEGYLSRFHIPFQMNDNVLFKYTQATGGSLDSERNLNGIEKSYQHIAEEARNQYTLVYYSHQPAIDGKFRKIEVRVDRPAKEVEVTAKEGYYPTARDAR